MSIGKLFKSLLSGGGKVDLASRFERHREAISGTMSKFYLARDRETKKMVGVKVLDKEKTATFESRFAGLKKPKEGEIATAMQHPRIVETYEHGATTEGEQFLVMEFLEGPGLNSLIVAREPKLKGRRVNLIRQMAEAVAYVHEAGYIHRDICPRNFVASKDLKTVKLIDFGLTVPATKEFMQPGNRTGTPNYMSPEVVRRKMTDQRLDIFSFGATAYELLAFELPWERAKDGRDVVTRNPEDVVPLEKREPEIDPRLAQAVMACLDWNPASRPQTMQDFLTSIAGVSEY